MGDATPTVRLHGAAVRFGDHRVFEDLTLDLAPGEFLAVLGPNGSGKTTLLKVLLGLQPLTSGTVEVAGRTPRRGSNLVGYIPQQKGFDLGLPLRGRDLVRLGLDGHRWGTALPSRERRRQIDRVIDAVGARGFADAPIGLLSGGEQQRLRIAQALLGDPRLLLCDEPLLSLDMAHQSMVTALIDKRRRTANTAVVFVTHELNPILPLADRVLYLVGGRGALGTPSDVMTSETLSNLYGTQVDVLHVRGRMIVVGIPENPETAAHSHLAADAGQFIGARNTHRLKPSGGARPWG